MCLHTTTYTRSPTKQSLLQLYLISSCDSIAMPLKQDEFCYQKSSESGETALVSYKNCHNFKTERF